MIDNYAKITICIRLISLMILLVVLYKQIKIFREGKGLFLTKVLLTVFTCTLISSCVLSLWTNLYRDSTGNLITEVRHTSMVVSSTASLMAGVALFILYKDE